MDWKDVRYLYDKDGTVSDVRYVPLSEAEARIKELEEDVKTWRNEVSARGRVIEHLEAENAHMEKELMAWFEDQAPYGCAEQPDAVTYVIYIKKGASESKSLEIDIAGVRCFSCGSKAEEGDCVYLTPKGFSCPVCLEKGGF